MSGPVNHSNRYGGYRNYIGRPVNPTEIGEIKGACFECPGKSYPKDGDGCANCARLGKGRADCWDPRNYVLPKSPSEIARKRDWHECKHPDCKELTRSTYCQPCASVVNNRRHKHRREHPGATEVPIEILHAPINWKKSSIRGKSFAAILHKDDFKLPTIQGYAKKLEIAKNLGYRSVSACLKGLYVTEGKGLRPISKALRMYQGTVSKYLKLLGVTMNKPGGHK